ncbi:hypothetical protein [Helicobacter sp.]|uniref:hypothetical protein n=1 Tax=Helicobacter sp. TaxID=218 RepID=UPI00198751C2|nr:hypothetical protein [Helicobacter sp.]MBD5165544.1 hypothetical protein [Helicobacter sp.]
MAFTLKKLNVILQKRILYRVWLASSPRTSSMQEDRLPRFYCIESCNDAVEYAMRAIL